MLLGALMIASAALVLSGILLCRLYGGKRTELDEEERIPIARATINDIAVQSSRGSKGGV